VGEWRAAVTNLLEVENLTVKVPSQGRMVTIVDRVNFAVAEGQVVGIAGESGSGKTMSTLALLRLLPPRAVLEGSVVFDGNDLVAASERALRSVRGRQIAMVFQDPMASMHPMLSIGRILTDHLRVHFGHSRSGARARAIEMLEAVRIPDPEKSLRAYPHQFSGGMRQRIAIASALICEPRLLIADEPTTALDVTVQAGILRLLDSLRRERQLSVMLITHDLGVMSALANVLNVMYAGRIVEAGATRAVVQNPRHPYTRALLAALPRSGYTRGMRAISGSPPAPQEDISGCPFHPRCEFATSDCGVIAPRLTQVEERWLACPPDPLRIRGAA
jgi:oligopeptide transport system ATP-binding protein